MRKQCLSDLSILDQIVECTKRLLLQDSSREEKRDAWRRLTTIVQTGYGSKEFLSLQKMESRELPSRIEKKAFSLLKRIEDRQKSVQSNF